MHYLPRKFPRTVLSSVVALLGAGALPAVAAAHPSHRSGYVYVDDNAAGPNTIAGFARRADGSLAPLPGSPFHDGGVGTGSALASQGAVQISSDGRYLLAVDAGSNQISVLRLRHHGGLKLVSVAPSGGVKPVSVAEHD
ncbi:MAG: beta-propeller fold lactonase family protein, partial [Actinomycetota bacterium]